jgi:pimeloyl-ACP methyl ester carboxylesterase
MLETITSVRRTHLITGGAHFFGYSVGGWIAFGLAVHHPALVRSLIVGGAHPYEDTLASFQRADGTDQNVFIAALEGFIGERVSELAKPMRLQNDLIVLTRRRDTDTAFNRICNRFHVLHVADNP